MRRVLLTAASLLGLTGVSAAADPVTIASTHDGDLAAIRSLLPADHPEGVKATATLVLLKRAPYMHDSMLATFIVDYEPRRIGGLAPYAGIGLRSCSRVFRCHPDACLGRQCRHVPGRPEPGLSCFRTVGGTSTRWNGS
jgi:hypothetical protein